MGKIYGYCRISTQKQSMERQIRNIRAACPEAVIVQEVGTGARLDGRKAWAQLRRRVQPGDTIVFDSVSRMSRDAEEGFALYEDLFHEDVRLIFLKEPHINTDTYREAMNRQIERVDTGDRDATELMRGITEAINLYMMRLAQKQIRLAFDQAEKEVADLRQRTREGIETARLCGKQIGRRPGQTHETAKGRAATEIIRRHSKAFGGTLSDEECRRLAGIARNTYYKYKKAIRDGE